MTSPEVVQTARIVLQDPDGHYYGFIRPLSSNQRGGSLDMSGGRVDSGELPAEAAVREVHEETGVIIRGPVDFLYGVSDNGGGKWFTRWVYSCQERVTVADIRQLPEHIGMVCASKATILELITFPAHVEALNCHGDAVVA